jgi:protein SCO1/2
MATLHILVRAGAIAALLSLLANGAARADTADAAHTRHHLKLPDAAARSTASYPIPRVQLLRADGKRVWLADELDDGRPVVLDFIYTTCTTLCPLSSQTFAALQEAPGVGHGRVHLISISIDPEQDTPDRLAEYAQHFNAGPQWQFYTGTIEASLAVQRSFRAYFGDKMSHPPLTLVRSAPGKPWVRFDGFASVDQLLGELHDQVAVR